MKKLDVNEVARRSTPETPMKYMFLIYSAENVWTDESRNACMVESIGVCQELAAKGKFVDAAPLESVNTAKTVRVRNGQPLITDGPFAETTEQLGGYYVLNLADLDEAIAVATRLPPVKKGTVEIRPMATLDGLPTGRPHSDSAGDTNGKPYLLLIYQTPPNPADVGKKCNVEEVVTFTRKLDEAGAYLSCSPLHPPATATSVRVRGGTREITDGPFAETNEVLGGYYLIRARSREAAVNVAAQLPMGRQASIEVRPLFDLSVVRDSMTKS
jgi:hypothetical protein